VRGERKPSPNAHSHLETQSTDIVYTVQSTIVSRAFEHAIFRAASALISYYYRECEQSLGRVSVVTCCGK